MIEYVVKIGLFAIFSIFIGLLLPSGKTSILIKSVISIISFFIIIFPILEFINKDFDLNFNIQNVDLIDYNFIEYYNYKKNTESIKICENILKNNGINVFDLSILYEESEVEYKINKVIINLKNSVINSNKEHIVIIDEIKKSIASNLDIKENLIEIYE